MTPFEAEVFDKLRSRLNLMHVDPATVLADTVLFTEGLGLDSLDALEIVVLVEQDYGIVISVAERTRAVFGTVGTLAAFIEKNRNRDKKA